MKVKILRSRCIRMDSYAICTNPTSCWERARSTKREANYNFYNLTPPRPSCPTEHKHAVAFPYCAHRSPNSAHSHLHKYVYHQHKVENETKELNNLWLEFIAFVLMQDFGDTNAFLKNTAFGNTRCRSYA